MLNMRAIESIFIIIALVAVFIFGLLGGVSAGKSTAEKNLLESCEKHGIYIINGAAIQCPAIIKTK